MLRRDFFFLQTAESVRCRATDLLLLLLLADIASCMVIHGKDCSRESMPATEIPASEIFLPQNHTDRHVVA
ncbi:hypothetical protein DL89DRAFT_63261 [Linderina pennispora]|uniref:Uncharacterized protein n=1 Tax=Linderina pennispora TaxID=61395 RepID=A0A1Y1VRF7_9FUNG|nr:uncharacterized protein DL89DRAFT_63261 [Linderina pennispora]ORX63868.1 hypothetical protein DL89DRAFT_63261 [Linderina pennispora]